MFVFSLMSLKFDFRKFCDHAAHGRLADVQEMVESGELPVNGNQNDALVLAAESHQRRRLFEPTRDVRSVGRR
jgi:hypothetical protein